MIFQLLMTLEGKAHWLRRCQGPFAWCAAAARTRAPSGSTLTTAAALYCINDPAPDSIWAEPILCRIGYLRCVLADPEATLHQSARRRCVPAFLKLPRGCMYPEAGSFRMQLQRTCCDLRAEAIYAEEPDGSVSPNIVLCLLLRTAGSCHCLCRIAARPSRAAGPP